ncbi:MAG: stage 0 sporulation family protein [Clostridia bacterium]|nr:stage 0 sporulation family protein [Clostridia bacterium]
MSEKKDRKIEEQGAAEGQLPSEPVEIVGVNFREAGKIYYFSPDKYSLALGDRVIVDTSRGVEIGTVKVANRMAEPKEITSPLKKIIRKATEADLERAERNRQAEMDAAVICKKKIAAHGLEMSLVAVEYTFDNSKLIFYFTCESRVDFRELVKDLASTFHTRIELRQIGIRDEAKMMGGLAVCGRKYCCSGFLTDFVQVSIKMAKEQNFSLNSAKVSGACGRLMCCLRYEHEVYEEALRHTPPVGAVVATADGEGVVTETRPLAEEIKVKLQSGDKDQIKTFKCSEVKLLRSPKKNKKDEDEDKADAE